MNRDDIAGTPGRTGSRRLLRTALFCGVAAGTAADGYAQTPSQWRIHDPDRPLPPIVVPPPYTGLTPPPGDAIVLFDGTEFSEWRHGDGSDVRWLRKDGYMEVVGGTGDIFTRRGFGDVQLHLEFAAQDPPVGDGQDRSNSGVFFMYGFGYRGYEIQVLDSYANPTYADGQAASVYGQYPPLVNASRPPGEWQTLDIVFRRPRFDRHGELLQPARVTVLHNGVLVQDAAELWGPTIWLEYLPYEYHPDRLPLGLQDHGDAVRFRNVWIRELREHAEPGPEPETLAAPAAALLTPEELDRFVGSYTGRTSFQIKRDRTQLCMQLDWRPRCLPLDHAGDTRFELRHTAASVEFLADERGRITGATFVMAGTERSARREGS